MSTGRPLVSVLIPAYRERFFGEAFASALAQDYSPLEIVVSDDSPGEAIGAIVAGAGDARVRYHRNRPALGFGANFSRCVSLARGELLKFLNDDDRLRPPCVEVLAGALAANPAATLATSRRAVIDAAGAPMPAIEATQPVAMVSALVPGVELGDLVLASSTNFIGEPTTVMFRRGAVEMEDGRLFRWGGRDYHCLADLSVWLRLLARGPAWYAGWTLSEFRVHEAQEQRRPDVAASCAVERAWITRQARRAGFLAAPVLHRSALEQARARIRATMELESLGERERRLLAETLAEVEGEIGALPG
jgi:glycosyltransferase involved in cell wall biosynthesis